MTKKEDLEKWLLDNLSSILSFPVPPDLTEYILQIENDRDIEDYLKTLLDLTDSRHKSFIENYKVVRKSGDFNKGYKKKVDINVGSKKETKKKSGSTGKNLNTSNSKEVKVNERDLKESGHKKKTKFVNLYSAEGKSKDVILLKGRHHCDCQASKHRLINNCLKCGRIVCEQEGSGPCIFCNTLVCSNEEQQVINANTKHSQKLYQNLMNAGKVEGCEEALKQRDRLLEYDRTSERRTKVIDDEGEYFSSSAVWLSKEEREKVKKKEDEMQARKHTSRLSKKITLDFAGREVREEEDEYGEEFFLESLDKVNPSLLQGSIHPGITSELYPTYIESNSDFPVIEKSDYDEQLPINRVQDKQFLEMSDSGACLSMHQPWASLLVTGIKRHEGRTWYTSHRGRLWIASASKTPVEEEISEIENIYKVLLRDDNIKFPDHYPVGCLLGCVTVVDCLPQEEYREKYPEGESDSPFVFICEDPFSLNIKFPITGRHKIYKLDSKIHQAAQKSLLRLAKERAL